MKKEEAKYLQEMIDSIQYDRNVFTAWYGEEKVIIGALVHNDPVTSNFFNYATIYSTILDLDRKIKYSFQAAMERAEELDFEKWNPILPPSAEENTAMYYAENAIFRIMILWDLLAQLFNIKAGLGKPFDKIYAAKMFQDAQQGKNPDPFAKRVYDYMTQSDNTDVKPWEGNHAYMKDCRNEMTHRSSPNMTTMSDYSFKLRMPVAFVLKRAVEDYKQVSDFIQEMISDIVKDYKMLENANSSEEE